MRVRFPRCLAIAQKLEDRRGRDLWELGDALNEEADIDEMNKVTAEFETHGLDVTLFQPTTLKSYRTIAANFPTKTDRRYSFSICHTAYVPEVLKEIEDHAGSNKLTYRYVRLQAPIARERLWKRDQTQRKAAYASALKAREQAEAEAREAARREREAQNERERTAAARDKEEAEQRRQAAEQARKESKTAPVPTGSRKPIPRPRHVVVLKALADGSTCKMLARRNLKALSSVYRKLEQEDVDAISEAWTIVQNDATAILNLIRKGRSNRGHLSVAASKDSA